MINCSTARRYCRKSIVKTGHIYDNRKYACVELKEIIG